MKDELRRAYAVLGLPLTAPTAEVRRKYRALVRQWHPDRYASDEIGQQEASRQMAAINAAFRMIRESTLRSEIGAPAAGSRRRPVEPGARLRREDLDRIVSAIGTDGPIDQFFGALNRYGERFERLFLVIAALLVATRLVAFVFEGGLAAFVLESAVAVGLGALGLVLLKRTRQRQA